MNDLEEGIKNLTERLKDKNLSTKDRKMLEMQLQSMKAESELRKISNQPFYKDEP